MDNSTIYALSTPFAKSAIAIVRVSGKDAKKSLKLLSGISNPTPFKFTLITLKNLNNTIIDKPLMVFFPNKKSYTGEDLVEYHIHGSIAIIKELLNELSKISNHRLAYPGEFTKRALENNKMNLIEVEGLSDLINSETYLQKEYALKILNGISYNKYNLWLNIIKENLSLIEASIDFSDEDLPKNLLDNVDEEISKLTQEIELELNNYKSISKLKNGINIAIIGIPNVGKSTLINHLAKDDIAITSSIAGTTRDAISISLDFKGYPITITDTAGIRLTKNSIENLGINKAINKAKEADLIIVVLDANNLNKSLAQVENYIKENTLFLVNKIDLIKEKDFKKIDKFLKNKNIKYVNISLELNIGLDILEKILINLLKNISNDIEHPIIINERHKSTTKELLLNLKEFNNKDIVLKSYYLHNAMNILGSILGLNNIEDILDKIFSNFCIGK